MPYTFTAYTLCALSLTGIPLFCGFVSKWQLLQATLRAAGEAAGNAVPDSHLSQILPYIFYAGTTALVIAAFLCAMYTLSISVRAFFPMDDKDWFREKKVKEAGPLMLVPIWIFAAVNLALGVCPGPILAVLTAIGEGRM
jgi:multicomponent Na+:H+ antiporter subunit D